MEAMYVDTSFDQSFVLLGMSLEQSLAMLEHYGWTMLELYCDSLKYAVFPELQQSLNSLELFFVLRMLHLIDAHVYMTYMDLTEMSETLDPPESSEQQNEVLAKVRVEQMREKANIAVRRMIESRKKQRVLAVAEHEYTGALVDNPSIVGKLDIRLFVLK